jgi:glyoxylate reductase
MAPRVFVTRHLPDGGLDPLADGTVDVLVRPDDEQLPPEGLARAAAEHDALVCLITDRIDDAVLAAGRDGGRLKVVANVAVGFDNVDVAAATAAGILVTNTPGVLTDTTADIAWSLILAASRRTSEAERALRAGDWKEFRFDGWLGHDVTGATLGVVGYGRIGRAVAARAAGFAMEVLHHSRRDTGESGFVASLDELLARSDIVSLHAPLTPETRHLIGAAELARMKPTAVLVNTARGPMVDEGALADALEAGRLFAAGLDVYVGEPTVNPRLLAAPRTVLYPHVGSASVATRLRMARMAAGNVADVLAGRPAPNPVNPEVLAR